MVQGSFGWTVVEGICFGFILISLGGAMSYPEGMPAGINCTFDSGLCGWRQSLEDNFDWVLWSGPTTAEYTGPLGDHTTGLGHYVYANASNPRVPKDRARLVFSPFTSAACLTLHFYMHGPAVDELRLLLDGEKVLSIVGERGDRWMVAQTQINGSNSELVLEAVVGPTWHGDIAVDDIFVSEQCNVSGCLSLSGLHRANVTCTNGNSVGSTCNISCFAGYSLFGPSSQTCLTSGVWSGRLSNCVRVEVRLSGGHTSTVGRVEIAINGVWGTVCDDDWNLESASVVCTMLGLPKASAAPGNSAFGLGQGRIWLDSVTCTGNETSIVQCGHKGWGAQDDCDHREDAGVICGPVTSFDVRLAEGSGPNQGRVEVSINGIWGTVCDDSWDMDDAQVVCRMLALPQATAATLGKSFGGGVGPVWMDDVKCVGNESSLLLCPRADLGVKNCAHFEDAGVVCGLPTIQGQTNVARGRPTTQSSAIPQSNWSFAVDGSYSTCATQEEYEPWWRVDLDAEVYIYTVHLMYNNSVPRATIYLGRNNSSNTIVHETTCVQKWMVPTESNYQVFHCSVTEKYSSVLVSLSGVYGKFSLCEVDVFAVDSANETVGILREVWFGAVSIQNNPILKFNPAFTHIPQTLGSLQQFHVAPDYRTKYGQRLSAFLQPTESGFHAFQLACEDECELWVREEEDEGLGSSKSDEMNRLLMKLTRRTELLQWDKAWFQQQEEFNATIEEMTPQQLNRYPNKQSSEQIYLSVCFFYLLEAFSRDGLRQGHLSVGMTFPNGSFERPIRARNLWRLLPGRRHVHFTMKGMTGNRSVEFGSNLTITASYHYCCEGMFCPNCPINLRFFVLNRSFTVDEQLNMSCKEKEFSLNINAYAEPGNYPMEARFVFINDTSLGEWRINFGFVHVKVSVIQQCSFNNGLCQEWKNEAQTFEERWKFSPGDDVSFGGFAYVNGSSVARLESPTLTQEETGNNVHLCLKFWFLMSQETKNNIIVWVKSRDNWTILMNLTGYHGKDWSAAQVSWTSVGKSTIVFQGQSTESLQALVAIDDVKITTEKCETEPGYAEPGHTCRSDQFRCNNGECVTVSLRCDGDVACRDESDERDCKCLSHQFSCPSGSCVSVGRLCDGSNDCEDGSDEERCDRRCSEFQCVDGTCIPWSSTCSSARNFCRDNAHFPEVCEGNEDCSLKNLGCGDKSESNSKCTSIRGYCTFERGLCGFTHDENADFHWSTGQGTTPSQDTGPSFDHTTLSKRGHYIFIEASQRALGDQARLMSDWLAPMKNACLQFWYHMHGRNVGALNIYFKTNESEKNVWRQDGDQGHKWVFAQTRIEELLPFRVIFEGVVNDGPGGDIALDDMALFDGNCTHTVKNKNPGCTFDSNTCDWHGHKDWIVRTDLFWSNWRSPNGGHLYLEGGANIERTISSPPFNAGGSEGWKCVRFWYYSGGNYFKRTLKLYVISKNGGNATLIWSHDQETMEWLFIQLPLHVSQSKVKLMFQGRKDQPQPLIAVDDVSFSKESCEDISAPTECYHYSVLNTRDRLVNYSNTIETCDDALDLNRWYRFAGAAGNQMANFCVPFRRCGARYPGWMDGLHPAWSEGVVTRSVCFVLGHDCCYWRNTISVRNCGEFYVYKLASPLYCDQRYCGHDTGGDSEHSSQEEWVEWKNMDENFKWRMRDPEELQNIVRGIRHSGKNTSNVEDSNHTHCYELHLPVNESGHLTLVGKQSPLSDMTMCLWVQTNQSVITINYGIAQGRGRIWAIPLIRNDTTRLVMEVAGVASMKISDDDWNHVCFTWTSVTEAWKVYKNGALVELATDSVDKMTSSERNISDSADILGKISGFNLWSMYKGSSEISYMSYGDGGAYEGDVISWSTVKDHIVGSVLIKTETTCKHHHGPRLTIVSSYKGGTGLFLSPWFQRSANWYGSCLRFRYQLYGPGAQALRVYQRLPFNSSEPVVWADNDNSFSEWKSGELSIAAMSRYQVIFEGTVTDRPGYIAVGGFFVTREYCKSMASLAKQGCIHNLTADSGYITSPYYPGYYSNNTLCKWTITAPVGHVIRLEFFAFQLEGNPTCSKDYLELRDDEGDLSRVIGRYCGHTFPSFVETSSNKLIVTFASDEEKVRTGFKAYYYHRKEQKASCVQNCPRGCRCSRLSNSTGIVVTCRGLVTSPTLLPKRTVAIIAQRNKISHVQERDFSDMPVLKYLDLSNNVLLEIAPSSLSRLPSLKVLRLNGNFLKTIPVERMGRLHNLDTLDLGENLLETLKANDFANISSLRVLGLRENKIVKIDDGAFSGLMNLSSLYLNDNLVTRITKDTFKGLQSLDTLFLHNNKLLESTIQPDVFSDMKNLRHLTLDSFILCCYAKKSLQHVDCTAPQAAISSCEDLLKTSVIRLSIWLLGIVAVLGNILVIVWRACDHDENRVQSVLLTNLAISDLIMGVYLLLIAIQDFRWKGVYFLHDLQWREGEFCQFAGALSVLSSEVSVLMLAVITADRLVVVVWNLRFKRLTLRSAYAVCVGVWLLGATVAFFPMFRISYFKSEDSTTYFGRSAVCIPLQLSSERSSGWEYSASLFIALNFAIFVFILVAYCLIFTVVRRSSRTAKTRNTRREHRMAKRMIFIILTDFACWMPVIIIGILALTGHFHDPRKEAYVWIAVFVMPVNSSINPILYTFSAPSFKRRFLARSRRIGDAASIDALQNSTSKRRAKHVIDERPI